MRFEKQMPDIAMGAAVCSLFGLSVWAVLSNPVSAEDPKKNQPDLI